MLETCVLKVTGDNGNCGGGGGVVIEKVVIFVGVVTHYANVRVLYGLHNSYILSIMHGNMFVAGMLCREL